MLATAAQRPSCALTSYFVERRVKTLALCDTDQPLSVGSVPCDVAHPPSLSTQGRGPSAGPLPERLAQHDWRGPRQPRASARRRGHVQHGGRARLRGPGLRLSITTYHMCCPSCVVSLELSRLARMQCI